MLVCHPSQYLHLVHPPSHLLLQPLLLQLLVTDEAAKIAAPIEHAHPHPPEIRPCPLDIPIGDGQDALGSLREVAPWGSPHHNVPHVFMYGVKFPSRAGVVPIPRLRDLRVRGAELTYEMGYPDAIDDHGKGFHLGHSLLDMQ